ncbi:hypothetical protein G3O01_30695 [Burkholderia sp. Ac-20365]|nr:hypothetical protein [Burkholderia sp. Ac-20365]
MLLFFFLNASAGQFWFFYQSWIWIYFLELIRYPALFAVHAFFAGIRDLSCLLQALPLCGAALTFFAAAKKVSKESGLTPPVLDHRLRALNGSSPSHGVLPFTARCQRAY